MLSDLITSTLIAFIAAFITNFLFWCMGNPENEELKAGRIFSAIGRAFKIKYEKYEGKGGLNFFKILVCPYCFNVWLCMPLFFLFSIGKIGFFTMPLYFVICVSISHFVLDFIRRAFR